MLVRSSKQHRKSEFGRWEKSLGYGVSVEENRDEGALWERIRCYGRTWGHGRDWGIRTWEIVCVCVCVFIRGQIGKRKKNIMGEDK